MTHREPTIVHEDEHLLVLDKPPGLLSFPPTTGSERNLTDLARARERKAGRECHAVHRLDRDTSGIVVFARTHAAKDALERGFREGSIEKTYLAIVNGAPRGSSGSARSFIVDQGNVARSSRRPVAGGKTAVTDWRVLERFARAALIEAKPRTGRFNQIRLHCVDLGCPIAGERKYAIGRVQPVRARRVMLHAWKLALRHPGDGTRLEIECEPPDDFASLLASLREA